MHTLNTHTNTFNNTRYSIQKRVVFLLCIVSALMSASLWSMTASAAAPVALSHILSVQTYAGGGSGPDSTSDGASTQTARFDIPNGLTVAPDGRLFITDRGRLRVVSADGSTVSTYAGGGSVDVDSASTSNIRFRRLQDVAIHPDGRVFVLDGAFFSGHRVYVIDPTGSTASVYAGGGPIGGFAGSFADGASTTTARFDRPLGMALHSDGRLFIADTDNHRIRVISADGATVSTYAGNGNPGLVDGDVDAAEFNGPVSLAFATDGRLFVGDGDNRRIRVISADGNTVSTYAGRGATGETGADSPFPPADSIDFFDVAYIAITNDGRILVSDDGSSNIRVISADGSRISVYAGADGVGPDNRRPNFGTNPLNEGPAAEAGFRIPRGIAIDATGRVFVANSEFNLVSVIAPSLAVADIPPVQLSAAQQVRGASVISAGVVQSLFSDADGSTLSYSLVETSSAAVSFAIDSVSGAITYLQPTEALANTQTLVIAASDEQGTATSRLTVVSEPLSNYPPQFRLSTSAITRAEEFADPITITIKDPDDGDTDGIEQPITYSLRIDPNDLLAPFATFAIDPQSGTITITSISGAGAFGNITVRVIADDGSNSHSESEQSFTLTVTQVNNTPPVIAPSLRTVRTYAGSGVSNFADGSALTAQFNRPSGIARTTDGRFFVADSFNHRIRVINADGATVSTYAGEGVQAFADGSTTTARFSAPRGIALAADGRLFVADERNHRIRVISADGATVSTYAGDGFAAFADGSTSTARFRFPTGVALAADGRLFVADSLNHRIRVISADGATVSTYAGSASGFANGSTTTARFRSPRGIALAADGRVFVADTENQRIRVISADGATISTYAGDGVEGFADGSTTTARFDDPNDVVVTSDGRVFVTDTGNHRIRVISADGAAVSTYAGSGAAAQANEPQELQAALDIALGAPQRMIFAPDGRLFFTGSNSHRIRVIEVISSTSENFGSVTLGAGFQGAGTRIISAQSLFFDAEANDLTFSILSGNEDGLFAIDAASGRVTLAGSLTDRQTGINTLVIQAQDSAGSATVTLTIVVEEVNHPPTFTLSATTLELNEDFGTNTDIVVVNPDDGDAAIEQPLTYSIFTNNLLPAALAALVTIAISTETGAVSLSSVDNAFGEVILTVVVDDSSDTDNRAQQTFLLRINSVNDAPRFTLSDAAITLEEGFSENTSITVSSSDDGDGSNQPLTYSISPANTGFATLAIDAQSGTVTITSIAEGFGSAVITVTVDDASATNNVATQTFMLTVSNVNDAPNFTLSTNVLTLNEDFGSNVVGIIENADDGDGTNQVLSYSVSTNNVGFSTLTINPQSGTLTLTSIADAFGEATLTITVTDSSATNNEATQVLRLRVLPVNDPPAFSLSTTTLSLEEDFAQAITVSVVNPNDGDADGMEQTLTYSISPASSELVAISFDANSGQVILNSVADANSINPILFEITAHDGGAVNNLFSQSFTLEIQPVDEPGNDPPNVVLSTAVLTLDEDFGSASITVVSSDDGDGTNQPLTYSVSPNNIGFATISIDSNSGAITLSSVDNQFGQATLFVTVDDSAPEDNLSVIQVIVEARAVNDVPAFTFSRTALTLDEDFGSATVNVASSDDGDNGVQTLSYTISTMNVAFATLTIDSASGEVRLSSVPNAIGSATITVTVDDASATNNVATQTFTLTVNAVNDPPVFALSTAVLTLNEDFGTNTNISVVSANDGDNGDQEITYRINPTNTGFATLAIDATGEVTISSVANGFGSAVITVIAEDDGGGNTNQSTQTFMLTVLDVVDSVLAQRISVYAGQAGDNALVNGSSSTARFDTPKGLALRADGSLLIVDSGNNVIRLISADGATVSTYPDSSATSTFTQLADIAATVDGRVFVADSGERQILVISADGSTVSVYAGSGIAGSENGNSLATAQFNEPVSLAVAEDGRLFIGDVGNNQIRVINADGSAVSTYFDGDGQFVPNDISIAADGRVFVADTDNNRVAVINAARAAAARTVTNYAGANAGYVDGAIASAQFNQPQAAFIAGRTVFIADSNNDVVRLIGARASTVSTLIADTGDLVLDAPAGIVVSTDGRSVFIADQNNHRIVLVETGNNLPTISAPATFSLPVNANRSISVTATDTDETGSLSFQVSGGTDLLTLTTATNSLMILSGSDMGSTTLTLHTSDSLGARTYAELVVTVTDAVEQPGSGGGGDSSGGGGGGCSLQSESGAIDWTLWLLALLSLAALRGYRRST